MLNIIIFYIGCCFGSFLNQIALQNKLIIKFERSNCPSCSIRLKSSDLLPLFSFILTIGKCRYCKHQIPHSYFMSELICGGLFTAIYNVYQFQSFIAASTLILAYLYSLMDHYHLEINPRLFYIPNTILLGSVITKNSPNEIPHIPFALLLLVVLFIITKLLPNSLGGADIKLLTLWSILFEPLIILITLITASTLGILYSLVLTKKSYIPFIPFLTIGLFLALLLNK